MSRKLDHLLHLAEQLYIGREVELLITTCIQEGDLSRFNILLQELVFAGPMSLFVLRDVNQLIRTLKIKISQESLAIRQDLKQALLDFRIRMPDDLLMSDPESWWRDQYLSQEIPTTSMEFTHNSVTLVNEICIDAGNKVSMLAHRLGLLNELEQVVQDWISGIVYELAHDYDVLFVHKRDLLEH